MSSEMWCKWITNLVLDLGNEPEWASVREPPDLILIHIFENLQRPAAFLQGLSMAYETWPTKRHREGCFLLSAISNLRPVECKRLLQRNILSGAYKNLPSEIDIELLAIVARCQYDIDDEIYYPLINLARESTDAKRAIFLIQIISKRDPHGAFLALNELLSIISNSREEKALERVLRAVAMVHGTKPLLSWFTKNVNQLDASSLHRFKSVVQEILPRGKSPIDRKDPFGILLSLAVNPPSQLELEDFALLKAAVDSPLLRVEQGIVSWVLYGLCDSGKLRPFDALSLLLFEKVSRKKRLTFDDALSSAEQIGLSELDALMAVERLSRENSANLHRYYIDCSSGEPILLTPLEVGEKLVSLGEESEREEWMSRVEVAWADSRKKALAR